MLTLRSTAKTHGACNTAAKGDNTLGRRNQHRPAKAYPAFKSAEMFSPCFVSNHGELLHQVGASIKLHIEGPFYVGIGLSSHNPAVTEKVTFSNVKLLKRLAPSATPATLTSTARCRPSTIADNLAAVTPFCSQSQGRFHGAELVARSQVAGVHPGWTHLSRFQLPVELRGFSMSAT